MSTVAYKVFSDLEQRLVSDKPKEVYFVDYHKANALFAELANKYLSQDYKLRVVDKKGYMEYFEVLDECHGDDYKLYIERIEIGG